MEEVNLKFLQDLLPKRFEEILKDNPGNVIYTLLHKNAIKRLFPPYVRLSRLIYEEIRDLIRIQIENTLMFGVNSKNNDVDKLLSNRILEILIRLYLTDSASFTKIEIIRNHINHYIYNLIQTSLKILQWENTKTLTNQHLRQSNAILTRSFIELKDEDTDWYKKITQIKQKKEDPGCNFFLPQQKPLDLILALLKDRDPLLNINISSQYFQPKPIYEALIKSIVSQRISFKYAQHLLSNFKGFTLEDVNLIDLSFLPKNKYLIIKEVNEFLCKQELTHELLQQLKTIKGIGLWTIQTTLILSNPLKNIDIFPKGDIYLKSIIKTKYNKHLYKVTQNWIPYRSIACILLWKS